MPNPDFSKIIIGGMDIIMTDDNAQSRLDALEAKVPTQASDQNQMATEEFVNSSVATATATHRGTFNLVSDLSLTVSASQADIATALASAIATADNNDYAFVQVSTADGKPAEIARVERYKHNGTAWAYEYTLNNSGFTAAQWAALNSAITSGLVSKLNDLPTNAELTALLGQKQPVISDLATIRSGAAAGATAVQPATLTAETNRAKAAEKAVADRTTRLEGVVPVLTDALPTTYTLEGSSASAFSRTNPGAAERYAAAMGGYLFLVKNGTVYAAKLNPSDWGKFADGTAVTSAVRAATETMIHVPDCHFKASGQTMNFGGLSPVAGGHTFGSPHWVGAYQMSSGGHSRPGGGSDHTKTMTAFWNLAQAIGPDFGLANYQFHCLVNALYQARYGELNSESLLSNGNARSSASWEAYRDLAHGKADSLGDGTGCVAAADRASVTRYVTKLFGFEDLFGKVWEFRPGIRFYMDGSTRHAVIYDGNVVSNTATGRDISGVLQSASGAYVNAMELGEYWDMLPKSVSGSDTTYYCDGYWAATTGELLVVGGPSNKSARCGVAYSSSSSAFSYSSAAVGARLAFYGSPVIVSGAELLAMING